MPGLFRRVLILGVFLCATPAGAQQYQTRDLGTLGGSYSSAAAINASGQVVGASRLAGDGVGHPFLWDNGVMHDLGVLPGYPTCSATAINDVGQVVGVVTHGPASPSSAFSFHDGGYTELGEGEARGINDAGQIW